AIANENRKCGWRSDVLDAAQIVVDVIEGRHGDGEWIGGLCAVAELICDEFLRVKIRAAFKQYERRGGGRVELAIDTRRRSHRARDRCPEQILRVDAPRQAGAGLHLD